MKRILFLTTIIYFSIENNNSWKTEITSIKEDVQIVTNVINNNVTIGKESTNIFKKGDIVRLFKKEEWSVKQRQMVKATKASIFSDKRSLTDEHLVATYPNGTKAKIIEVYEEKLRDNSIWRVYKVKTMTSPSKEGWIADFNVMQ